VRYRRISFGIPPVDLGVFYTPQIQIAQKGLPVALIQRYAIEHDAQPDNVIWYPAILAFVGCALANVPRSIQRRHNNKRKRILTHVFVSRQKDLPENGMDACLMAMSRISTPG
jgi:hypothetical protein